MRTFLLTVYWVSGLGSVIQLLIIVSASWIVFTGVHSFSDLDVSAFITQYIPMFVWIKALVVKLLGDFGYWILSIPILILAPLKLITGTAIGLWAYSVAKSLPVKSAQT